MFPFWVRIHQRPRVEEYLIGFRACDESITLLLPRENHEGYDIAFLEPRMTIWQMANAIFESLITMTTVEKELAKCRHGLDEYSGTNVRRCAAVIYQTRVVHIENERASKLSVLVHAYPT